MSFVFEVIHLRLRAASLALLGAVMCASCGKQTMEPKKSDADRLSYIETTLLAKSTALIEDWPGDGDFRLSDYWQYGNTTGEGMLQTDKEKYLKWTPEADGPFKSASVIRSPIDSGGVAKLLADTKAVEGTTIITNATTARKVVLRFDYPHSHIYHVWLETAEGWKLMHSPFALSSALPMEIDKSLGLER